MDMAQEPKVKHHRIGQGRTELLAQADALAEHVDRFVEQLRSTTIGPDFEDQLGHRPAFDPRWISIGATDLQTGFMALRRAIERPNHF